MAISWHLPVLSRVVVPSNISRQWFNVEVPGDATRLRGSIERLVEPGIQLGPAQTACIFDLTILLGGRRSDLVGLAMVEGG